MWYQGIYEKSGHLFFYNTETNRKPMLSHVIPAV